VTVPAVAVVSLGRDAAKGELRRVASWRLLFERVGAEVETVTVDPGRRPRLEALPAVVRGRAAPERLAWSPEAPARALRALAPRLVVVVSSRAFDPSFATGPWGLVLDFVDSLSRSYRDRAALVAEPWRRSGYRALAAAHARLERRLARTAVHTVAAGWSDARRLQAEWVPILADPDLRPVPDTVADRDVLFFGTLRYPPNVDALQRLGRLWPEVMRARPGTTALVAGSAPTPAVEALCAEHGWELVPDYPSLAAVAARARVAAAPLTRTAGIQIKILDAATLGLPQVVRSPALAGLDPSFPIGAHDDDRDFAAEIVRLLDRPDAATGLADRVRAHVEEQYGVDHWLPWATQALEGA
jgi:hypothetical protein